MDITLRKGSLIDGWRRNRTFLSRKLQEDLILKTLKTPRKKLSLWLKLIMLINFEFGGGADFIWEKGGGGISGV